MNTSTCSIPPENRFFEDYVVGAAHELGSIAVEGAEMIAFANRDDPQVVHTIPEAARKTIFGGLIASGWLTPNLMGM